MYRAEERIEISDLVTMVRASMKESKNYNMRIIQKSTILI